MPLPSFASVREGSEEAAVVLLVYKLLKGRSGRPRPYAVLGTVITELALFV